VSNRYTYLCCCCWYNCKLGISPYHRVFIRGTMQSNWIIEWHMSLDHIGLANHLVLQRSVPRYKLIHENPLLIMQISNVLSSWLPCWLSICHEGTAHGFFFYQELFPPLQNIRNRPVPKWLGFLACCAGLTSHTAFPSRHTCSKANDLWLKLARQSNQQSSIWATLSDKTT